MEDFDLSESTQDLVRTGGDKVEIHTATCVFWLAEHKNCKGCPSELGCAKSVRLMAVMMLPLLFNAGNYDDFQKMQNRISELSDKILKSISVKELLDIPSA